MYIGIWIWGLLGLCGVVIVLLSIKILLMQKAADEIREGISFRMRADTNTLIDIASRDKAMCALAESLNEELRVLRHQRQTYYQGNLALKEAVVNISHDIRTPLTAISGYMELMEKEKMSENNIRYLSIIAERIEVLNQLTEELFRYTIAVPNAENDDIRNGYGLNNTEMKETPANDLGKLLEESVLASYGALIQKGIEPDIQLPDKKVKCRINNRITRRIFENILHNTLKYSDGDLQIILNEQGEILFINHAAALDAVQIGKLFDRYFTVENAKTSTGLGLAIVKQLMEQMGGRIDAWYEEGKLYLKLSFLLADEPSTRAVCVPLNNMHSQKR